MIYIPGQPPSLETTTPDLIKWIQQEFERISALSRLTEEDIAAANTAAAGSNVRWDLDECYATTGVLVPVWPIDELNASAAYTNGTVRFVEGSA